MGRLGVCLLGVAIVLVLGGMGFMPALQKLFGIMDTVTIDYDVGDIAIYRDSYWDTGWTLINKGNPIDANTTIDFIEIWASTNMTGCKVGIFNETAANQFKCRSSATIGSVEKGSKERYSVSLSAKTGDYIGTYWTGGRIERSTTGGDDAWYVLGDYCDVNNETAFSTESGDAISLRGINGTADLSMTDSVIWRAMPYLIPLILIILLIAYLTGKIGGHRDESGGEG